MDFESGLPFNWHREPFGDIGEEIRGYAEDMLTALEQDVHETPADEWRQDDHELLHALLYIEDLLPLMATEPELRGEIDRELTNALFALRTALPFTEAEREWLRQLNVDSSVSEFLRDFAPAVGHREATIVSAGIRTVVQGRDLMRRWLAWRHQTDEYDGQDTVTVAREALADVIRILSPKKPPTGSDNIS